MVRASAVPVGTLSLRTRDPGVETPGYCRVSLRDNQGRTSRCAAPTRVQRAEREAGEGMDALARPTATRLQHSAQGWRVSAYLGCGMENTIYPNGVASPVNADATPSE